jgi:hypothetical protein
MSFIQSFPVLSIDAWADPEGGWAWNNWFHVGTVDVDLDRPVEKDLIQAMIDADYLKTNAHDLAEVEDDGYNMVFKNRETGEPVFAIEYGSTI